MAFLNKKKRFIAVELWRMRVLYFTSQRKCSQILMFVSEEIAGLTTHASSPRRMLCSIPFNANFLVLLQTKKKNVTRDENDHNFDSGNKVAFY